LSGVSCVFCERNFNMKRLLAVVCVTTLLLGSITGCGEEKVTLEQPYDIYETTGSLGLGSTVSAGAQEFFSNDLCVADDFPLGTDTTDSQVAEGAGTFNLATNEVVYAKNIYERLYPASTTKILTAYIALKYCTDLSQTVTISENAANQASDSSVCGLHAGDVIRMDDLLYGMMLRSGNDAAIAIAESISGSVEEFATLMNQEAAALGATQSHFVNPNGLPDENHYTSVYDLYLIFRAALQNETFVQIIGTTSYDVTYQAADGTTEEHTWENTNQYLSGHAKAPDGFTIIGGKTGTTGDAGYCLVLYSMNEQSQPIISIVLKADAKTNLYLLMNEMLSGFAN
jgi:D-alanyl-D-alanine carboxypeptidase (penicillin-binding protein 5/6)